MLFATTSVLALAALLTSISLAAPAGSAHNVYLVHCEPSDCDICDPGDFTLTAAAYFANGPPTLTGTNTRVTPTSFGQLSSSNTRWEGSARSVRLGTAGTFKSNIGTAARTAKKGELAGDATLGAEPFACFKDGTTKFSVTSDGDRYSCTADYWCGSVDSGTTAPVDPPQ